MDKVAFVSYIAIVEKVTSAGLVAVVDEMVFVGNMSCGGYNGQ